MAHGSGWSPLPIGVGSCTGNAWQSGLVNDQPTLLDVCRSIAEDVASFLVTERPEVLGRSSKSSPTDVVTEMDTAAEHRIRRLLAEHRPDDGMLGEEGTGSPGSTGVIWVVDPIDGTTNYLYRNPAWAVSIAAVVDGVSVAGCVAAPQLQMICCASRGGGAWWITEGREVRLAVSAQEDLDQALVSTGFGYTVERRRRQAQIAAGLLPTIRDIRRSGAASIDLCWVASGLVDAYYERGLHPWDFAAGALIVEEAGGVVSMLDGAEVWPTGPEDGERATIVASAQGISDPLRRSLIALGAADIP